MRRWIIVAFIPIIGLASGDDDAESAFRDAMALARAERWDDARAALLRGRSYAPSDKRFALELAGVAYKSGDREEAKREFHRALALDPKDAYANDALGSLYILEGRIDAALPYWNRVGKPRIHQTIISPGGIQVEVARAIDITPGEILRPENLEMTLGNLDRLGITECRLELTPWTAQSSEQSYDVVVSLGDSSVTGKNFAGRAIQVLSGLPYQALDLSFKPERGWVQTIDTMFRWDPEKRRIASQATGLIGGDPTLLYRIGIDARDENWDVRQSDSLANGIAPFNLRKIEFKGEIEKGFTGRLRWTNGISVSDRRYSEAPETAMFQSGLEEKGYSRISYDLLRRSEQRFYVTLNGEAQVGRFSGAGESFGRFLGMARLKREFGKEASSTEINAVLRAGRTVGQTPFDDLFMLGMERDNDLWIRGHVGTYEGKKGNAPLGGNYALAQFDVMKTVYHNVFSRWQIGPFADTGKITGPFGSTGWMFDVGGEVRVRVMRAATIRLICGHDALHGGAVFYTTITR